MNRTAEAALAAAMALAAAAGAALAGGDWPCWRGPNGDGKSDLKAIRTDWSGGLKTVWQVKDLCGGGMSWAAPVIRGNRLIVPGHFRTRPQVKEGKVVKDHGAGRDVVFCLDADTGRRIWKSGYDVTYTRSNHQAGSGPNGTPYIDGDRVYTQGAYGQVGCWALADGRGLWLKNVIDAGGKQPFYGYCISPLVHAGKVIVQGGGEALVVAFDKMTGEVAWKSGSGPASYAPPVAATINGREQIVVFTGDFLAGLDPATGRQLWSTPYKTKGAHNQVTPVIAGNVIFITSNYQSRRRGVAFRVEKSGKVTELWATSQFYSCASTPVLQDGHLYGYSNGSAWSAGGQLKCVELLTGKVKWETPRTKVTHEKGAFTYVDGHLLYKTYNSKLGLWKVSPERFEKVIEWEIPRGRRREAYTLPVVARGKLYVRDHALLTCYHLTK